MSPFIFQKFLVFTVIFTSLFSAGCWNRGRQSATGQIQVEAAESLILKDRNGRRVSFRTGPASLDYQNEGVTRSTSLFVLRSHVDSSAVLIELPTAAFLGANFFIYGRTVGQQYNIRGVRETEHLGHRIYDSTEGCTGAGVCCQTATRSTTDSNGNSTTETYQDCGLHSNCPGSQDVRLRDDYYKHNFFIHFQKIEGQGAVGSFRGESESFTETTRLEVLSSCRT